MLRMIVHHIRFQFFYQFLLWHAAPCALYFNDNCALPDIRVPAANQMHSAVNMCGRAQMLLINFSKSGGTVGKSRT